MPSTTREGRQRFHLDKTRSSAGPVSRPREAVLGSTRPSWAPSKHSIGEPSGGQDVHIGQRQPNPSHSGFQQMPWEVVVTGTQLWSSS